MRCARGVGLLGDRGGCGIHGQSDGVGVHCTGRVADTAAVLIAVHSVSGGRREVCLVVVSSAGVSPGAARRCAVLPLIAQATAGSAYREADFLAMRCARGVGLTGDRRSCNSCCSAEQNSCVSCGVYLGVMNIRCTYVVLNECIRICVCFSNRYFVITVCVCMHGDFGFVYSVIAAAHIYTPCKYAAKMTT